MSPRATSDESRAGGSTTTGANPIPSKDPIPSDDKDTTPLETVWNFPSLNELPEGDLVAIGADLEPRTLLAAYRSGVFPMPLDDDIGWFWPEERGVFCHGDLVISRSLRRSQERYTVTVDQAFDEVIRACGEPSRPHGWIDDPIVEAYTRLHKLGVAHSIEVWEGSELAGGLYGVSIAGLFAGESMFHYRTDASKVALVALVELLWPDDKASPVLLDVQWATRHLRSLGARTTDRPGYAKLLEQALRQPGPAAFTPTDADSPSTQTPDRPEK